MMDDIKVGPKRITIIITVSSILLLSTQSITTIPLHFPITSPPLTKPRKPPSIMRLSLISGVLLTAAATTTAFEHAKGDANGLYLHGFDAAGNPTVQYIGHPTDLKKPVAGKAHPRDLSAGLQLARRKTKYQGPTGNNGPNCDSSVKRDPDQFLIAEQVIGMACDSLSWWHNALSYVYEDVVAYACEYGNGNHCGDDSISVQNQGIDAACGNNTAGWYAVKDSLYATGRTAVGTQFCFKNEVAKPQPVSGLGGVSGFTPRGEPGAEELEKEFEARRALNEMLEREVDGTWEIPTTE